MQEHYEQRDTRFDFVNERDIAGMNMPLLCSLVLTGSDLSRFNISQRTVVMYSERDYEPAWNYCTFNVGMRRRFRASRAALGVLPHPPNEFWISVHFRWGDLATQNPEEPSIRMKGLSLSRVSQIASQHAEDHKHQTVRIFFVSEGRPEVFKDFLKLNPTALFHLDSDRVEEALDILWRSDVLIGGSSAFFALAVGLSENCTIVTEENNPFLTVRPQEWEEAKRHRYIHV